MEILYLPTATPKLSAVESVWGGGAKYKPITFEHYETLEDLTHAASEYFRTCSIRLDIYKFLYRCMWGEIFNERHSRILLCPVDFRSNLPPRPRRAIRTNQP